MNSIKIYQENQIRRRNIRSLLNYNQKYEVEIQLPKYSSCIFKDRRKFALRI